MNEPNTGGKIEPDAVGLNDADLENGAAILDRITAMPPQAEPVLVQQREKAAESASFNANEAKPAAENEAPNEPNEAKTLRVDPRDYAHIEDHKGRPFNPAMHQVNADGRPVFNARGKVKMIPTGETNPVRLILDPLMKLIPEQKEPAPGTFEAQAAVQIDDAKIRIKAECIADLYAGTGYLLRGGKFVRGWDSRRRPKIINSLINYERQTGKMMDLAPWVVLAHTFAADIVTVEGGEHFDSGGGLIGLIQRFKARRKAAKEGAIKQKGDPNAAA